MRPFTLQRASTAAEALGAGEGAYLAGGTQLFDLMKLQVMTPDRLVDISRLRAEHGAIEARADGLHLGALARMSEAADHPAVRRDYPVLADALRQAASAQLRNMASLAGTVLQRTRCNYFRDVSYAACNKRAPGSGCAAIGGCTDRLAVLGVSEHCIAHYPGDLAVALVALDAEAHTLLPDGDGRTLAVEELLLAPGDTPHIETALHPGELITHFRVPAAPWARRSAYVKVRECASYAFALASAAVALDLDGDRVRTVRIALGGLATKPWRSRAAETVLTDRVLDEASAREAAEAAFAGARPDPGNAYKVELGRRTIVRALLEVQAMEPQA